jgi:hypothetical protein
MLTFWLLLIVQVSAQTPNLIWAETYGNSDGFNQSLDCAADNSGNIFDIPQCGLMEITWF